MNVVSFGGGTNSTAMIIGMYLHKIPIDLILNSFRRVCPEELDCESCAMHSENTGRCGNEALYLRRAPQSWCYVEEK